MKIPLSWLTDYIDLDEPPRAIADRLTFSGTEVEGIETVGSTYEGFVVAEVRAVEKHPNADKLSVCRVFDGENELQVVCGAPNVQAGGRYPFARVGVTLPDGSLTIKKAKIRGVESFGMLCAADELGLSSDHSGLLVLDAKWAPGTPLAKVLGPPDTVFELEVTPNRPDCLSLTGIARELAAVYGIKRKALETEDGKRKTEIRTPVTDHRSLVTVEDSPACARYTARVLEQVTIGPSPEWMKQRLERAGIRSINNVVDITNYVMLETGHPLHAFDRDLLAGGRVVVRRAREGERMATLDGVERELDPSILVIADAERPVAVAGVMGGAGSEICEKTARVLLEAAWFEPALVRATARKLGLSTESSYRFERGVDIEGVEYASRRAAQLMVELAGAKVVGEVVDTRPAAAAPRRLPGRFQTVRDVMGVALSDAAIADIFKRLEIDVQVKPDGAFEAVIPSFRGDLEREIDLVEEVARIHGLDNVPVPHPRAVVDPTAGRDTAVRAKGRLRAALAGLGVSEILNYSLVSEPQLDLFDAGNKPNRVVIPRPISADQSVLRPSLVPQMVETLGRNRAHQADQAALYEIGRTFSRDEAGAVVETDRLCIGLMGPLGRAALDRRRAVTSEEMFLWAKGLLEALARGMGLGALDVKSAVAAYAEPGTAVELFAGATRLGTLALVDRRIRKEWRLTDPIAVMELDASALLARALKVRVFSDIPAFPSVARDVAMIVADAVSHDDIVRVIRAAAPPELEAVELFDIFKGPAIGAGRRSVAYSLTYRSARRTLTDDEANGYHDVVKAALRKELAAEIRES
jgi:phenylalanyl-tRNA synthetase beta chain